MKVKDIWKKLENSYVFWIGIILLLGLILTSFKLENLHLFFLLFPTGLFLLIKIYPEHYIIYPFSAAYWLALLYLIRTIVKDKKTNTIRVIILLFILALTFYGCTQGGGY